MFVEISHHNGNGSPEISLDQFVAERDMTQDDNRHLQILVLSQEKRGVPSPGEGGDPAPGGWSSSTSGSCA